MAYRSPSLMPDTNWRVFSFFGTVVTKTLCVQEPFCYDCVTLESLGHDHLSQLYQVGIILGNDGIMYGYHYCYGLP